VRHELVGDLVTRLDQAGEHLVPHLEDRVGVLPCVEVDRAVVGVHGGLDRVAHVVDLVGRQRLEAVVLLERVVGHRLQGLALRQRELVGDGVAVEHPLDPAVDHDRVGVGVHRQPRGDLLDHGARVAVVEDLGVVVDTAGEQEVRLAELHRVEQLVEQVADGDTARAGVGRLLVGLAACTLRQVELDVAAVTGLAHDAVRRTLLAVVDAGLVAVRAEPRQGVLVGLLALGPLDAQRLARVVLGTLVGVGRDDAVAVRVDRVEVGPVAVALRDAVLVELADTEDHGPVDAVDVVAVHVEHVADGVVGADLLLLFEDVTDHLGVDQRHARRHPVQLVDPAAAGDRGAGDGADLDLVERVGLAGRVDVLLDVLPLAVGHVGVHPDRLDQRRHDQAQDDRRQREEGDADRGQQPGAAPDVGEEEHRAHDRDAGQDLLGGQHGLVVGVAHAGEDRAGVGHQVESVEPVVDGLGEHEHRQERRDLDLRRAGQPIPRPGREADAAEEVVHQDRGQQPDDRERHHEVDDVVPERQVEDVEADVLLEVGVGAAEGLAVPPHRVVAPLTRGRRAREQPHHHGCDADDPAHPGRQELAVAVHPVVGHARHPRPQDRPEAVGHRHRQRHRRAHQAGEHEEQAHAGEQEGAEDLAVAEGPEPQPFGPEGREATEQHERDDQHDGGDHQRAGAPRGGRRSRRVRSGVVERSAHAGSLLRCSRSGCRAVSRGGARGARAPARCR